MKTRSVGVQTVKDTRVKAIQVRPSSTTRSVSAEIEVRPVETPSEYVAAAVQTEDESSSAFQDFDDVPDIEFMEESSQSPYKDDVRDPSYEPRAASSAKSTPKNHLPLEQVPKYLVMHSEMMELFRFCPLCGCEVTACSTRVSGTMLCVTFSCAGIHKNERWNSQPFLRNMPAGNLLLTGAIVVSGSSYQQFRRVADCLNLACVGESTFYEIQDAYIFPAIHVNYMLMKEALLASLCDQPLRIVGDARCDSPGFSAKYCTYSLMDTESGAVLTFSLEQVRPGRTSVALEVDGCMHALEELLEVGMSIEMLGTDCNYSVALRLRTEHPNITHQYDVYHLDKRVRKKLVAKAKIKENADLLPWIKSVSRHLWYCAHNCHEDPVELLEKWKSAVHHISNRHSWPDCLVYKKCDHPRLTRAEAKKKKFLKAGSPPHQALSAVVLDKTLLRDMARLTHAMHTGSLECLHNLMLKYCPKRQHFHYKGMLMRTELAVLDHNWNLGRQQATTKSGKKKFTFVFPKRSKEWLAKPQYEAKDMSWYFHILRDAVLIRTGVKEAVTITLPDLPPNIASELRPDVSDILEKHESRFSK